MQANAGLLSSVMQRYDAINPKNLQESLTKDGPVYIPVPRLTKRDLRCAKPAEENDATASKKRKADDERGETTQEGQIEGEVGTRVDAVADQWMQNGGSAESQETYSMQVDPT